MTAQLNKPEYMARVNDLIDALTALKNREINAKAKVLKYLLEKQSASPELFTTDELSEATIILADLQVLAEEQMQSYAEQAKRYQNADSEEVKALADLPSKQEQLATLEQQHNSLLWKGNLYFSLTFATVLSISALIVLTAAIAVIAYCPFVILGVIVGVATIVAGACVIGDFATNVADWASDSTYKAADEVAQEYSQVNAEVLSLIHTQETVAKFNEDKDYEHRFDVLRESMADLQADLLEELNVENDQWVDEKEEGPKQKQKKARVSHNNHKISKETKHHHFFSQNKPKYVGPEVTTVALKNDDAASYVTESELVVGLQ